MNEHSLFLRGLLVALIALALIPAMVELCNLTTKSHEYWVCVHGRISAGEGYFYAINQCDGRGTPK